MQALAVGRNGREDDAVAHLRRNMISRGFNARNVYMAGYNVIVYVWGKIYCTGRTTNISLENGKYTQEEVELMMEMIRKSEFVNQLEVGKGDSTAADNRLVLSVLTESIALKRVTEIYFVDCNLDDSFSELFHAAGKQSGLSHLKKVHIQGNKWYEQRSNFSTFGVRMLRRAVMLMDSLSELDLSYNDFKCISKVIEIAKIVRHPNLKCLSLSHCQITGHAALYIAEATAACKLECLFMFGNSSLTPLFHTALIDSLKTNRHTKTLSWDLAQFTTANHNHLVEVLQEYNHDMEIIRCYGRNRGWEVEDALKQNKELKNNFMSCMAKPAEFESPEDFVNKLVEFSNRPVLSYEFIRLHSEKIASTRVEIPHKCCESWYIPKPSKQMRLETMAIGLYLAAVVTPTHNKSTLKRKLRK